MGAMGNQEKLAFDRMSARRKDVDGRLHVARCNISKATVNPYLGREIPRAEELGLDPNRVYHLYRDPQELAAGAASFNNLPLMLYHVVVSADEPKQEAVVGTIGSDVAFEYPYLTASLAVWTDEAVSLIEAEKLEQLSCAYRYRADMTPGVSPEGLAYDGVMRDIMGNHVALVEQGRAGPDVVVADSLPPELKPMKSKFLATLLPMLAVAFTADQQIALDTAYAADRAKDEDDMDLSEDEMCAAVDAAMKEMGKDSLSDEEKEEAYRKAKDAKKAKDAAPTPPERSAADGALFTQADVDAARTEGFETAKAQLTALHKALDEVKPVVGMITCDSAGDAYKLAFEKLGIDVKGVPVEGYAALFAVASKAAAAKPVIAADRTADVSAAQALSGIGIKTGY
jgi:hypothetical protein